MSQERIVVLDPCDRLSTVKEILSRVGHSVERLKSQDALLGSCRDGRSSLQVMVVVVDGDQESGLEPALTPRLADVLPELPPAVLAVVAERRRGRAWTSAGAAAFLQSPVDAEDLRLEVQRWIGFSDRLQRSGKRTEAIRKFFAMFAHDLRNPLSAIAGYCELVRVHPQLPEEVREDLEKVQRNVDLLSSMANGLLEMVRGQPRLRFSPREAELAVVVKEAVDMLRPRASTRRIAIRVRSEAEPLGLQIDPPRLIEALANLIDNAIKFSPDDGQIEIAMVAEGPDALITIDDEGPGIPPEDREEVFDRFARAAASGHRGGLGLGLSIARDIIELHHGSIWIEGRKPRGTRMAIRLPRAAAAVAAGALAAAPSRDAGAAEEAGG